MSHDLQNLIEKIQRDGVAKAKADADAILQQARAEAQACIANAQAEAARLISAARSQAESFERRAEETIRQSARDAVLTVEKSLSSMLTSLLLRDVNAALGDTDFAAGLAAEAVRAYLQGREAVEVTASARLADALRAKLAAESVKGVTVTTDEATGTGFRIRLAGGRIEHAFTGAAVVEFLARPLRPRLAALLKSAHQDL